MAAIQQMGCGPADIASLCGFLGLHTKSILYHTKRAEHVLGTIQIAKRKLAEEYAVEEEIEAHKREEGLQLHKCKIAGHEHDPLPKLKGSYGS